MTPPWLKRSTAGRPRRQRLRDPIDWAAAQVVALLKGEPSVARGGRPAVAELRAQARERHRAGKTATAIAAELKVAEDTVRGWLNDRATPTKARALELLHAGTPPAEVAEALSVVPHRVQSWARELGLPMRPPFDERERCAVRLLAQGLTPEDVAWLLQLRVSRVRALRPPAQVAMAPIDRQRHQSQRARRMLVVPEGAAVAEPTAGAVPAAAPEMVEPAAAPPAAARQKPTRTSKKSKGDAPRPRGRPRKKVTAAPATAPREDQTPMSPAERVRRALLD